jgi:hypothetical protein
MERAADRRQKPCLAVASAAVKGATFAASSFS